MASYDHVHDDPHCIHVHCRSVGTLLDDLGRYVPCITFTRLAQRIMHQCPLHLTQSTKAQPKIRPLLWVPTTSIWTSIPLAFDAYQCLHVCGAFTMAPPVDQPTVITVMEHVWQGMCMALQSLVLLERGHERIIRHICAGQLATQT
jgi:hypothetical protein